MSDQKCPICIEEELEIEQLKKSGNYNPLNYGINWGLFENFDLECDVCKKMFCKKHAKYDGDCPINGCKGIIQNRKSDLISPRRMRERRRN